MRTAGMMLGVAVAAIFAQPAQACFREVPVTEQLVNDAVGSGFVQVAADAHSPEVLLGYLSYLRDSVMEEGADIHYGAIAFVRSGADWRAVYPVEGESAVGAFLEIAGKGFVLVTQMQVEGPGQSFTVARSDDNLRSGTCAVIDFPTELNKPGWAMETLALDGLSIDANGKGQLLASGEIDTQTARPRMKHWRYVTRDGGRSWSGPRPASKGARVAGGVFAVIEDAAPDASVAALASFAEGR